MITEVAIPNNTCLFVEVDQDSHSHSLIKYKTHAVIRYKRLSTGNSEWSENIGGTNVILLDYEIISTTKDITEEQAGNIVGRKFAGRYYEFLKQGMSRVSSMKHSYPFDTTKESLESLIKANGLDVTKNYLILKKL